MKKYMYFFSVLALSLCAEPSLLEEGSVSSTHASYDGNALLLQGHVHLDHGLGMMSAEQASLQKQDIGKDFPFSVIHLKKDVILSMKNNSQLKCDTAELDFIGLKGQLFSAPKEKVSYIDSFKGKGGKSTPFRLLSRSVELNLSKQDLETKKMEYEISDLTAKDDVIIDYADTFVLRADEAVYHRTPDETNNKKISGSISAYPKKEQSRCLVTRGTDRIEADHIHINLQHSLLELNHPSGTLASSLIAQSQKGELQFSCSHLIWDHEKQALTLQKNVHINDSCLGDLFSENEIHLVQEDRSGKKHIKSIHVEGLCQLKYQDASRDWNHLFISHGTLHVDGLKGNLSLSSPQEKGKTALDKQIYYEDALMGIHADQAFIEYSEPTFEPVALTLKGNVRVFSRDSTKKPSCGLADRLVYSPNTKTLILSAHPSKKVLFWDEEQGLRMSAQEVHLTEDPSTHKTQIKGIGNVHFSLSSEENEILKKFFPQYPHPQET